MEANPIKEIIFNVSFAESVNLDKLQEFTLDKEIKRAFPIIKTGYNTNLKTSKDGNPPITESKKTGYILKSNDNQQTILQVKIGLLAYHKTNGYQSFEELIKQFNKYWVTFQKCTEELSVNKVSLRYLNFIEINETEKIKDFVNIWTESPFEEAINSLTTLKFKIENNEDTEATIVVINGKDKDKDGIILDILLNRKIDLKKYKNIEDAFIRMREMKNSIFKKIITKKTLNKYNL